MAAPPSLCEDSAAWVDRMLFRFTKRTVWDVVRTTQPPRSYGRLLQSTPQHPSRTPSDTMSPRSLVLRESCHDTDPSRDLGVTGSSPVGHATRSTVCTFPASGASSWLLVLVKVRFECWFELLCHCRPLVRRLGVQEWVLGLVIQHLAARSGADRAHDQLAFSDV
jgi:hypothetical protein